MWLYGVDADAELRASAARHAAGASGSSPGALTQQELMRRLRETQALLIKFSEENSRLSSDNQMLQAGRKVLGVEHASVLDEIGGYELDGACQSPMAAAENMLLQCDVKRVCCYDMQSVVLKRSSRGT
jgi:hypothetical protein